MKKIAFIAVCSLTPILSSHAQPADTYKFVPVAQQKLVPSANGLTSQFLLVQSKNSTAQVTARDKSGEAEAHANWIDHIFVQDGGGTMILGGTIDKPHDVGPGETRGSSVTGGKSFAMHPGDYIFVPAGTTHRMVLAPGQTIHYAVVKARP